MVVVVVMFFKKFTTFSKEEEGEEEEEVPSFPSFPSCVPQGAIMWHKTWHKTWHTFTKLLSILSIYGNICSFKNLLSISGLCCFRTRAASFVDANEG